MDKLHLQFLPVSLNISGKRILMVGGGRIASHKIELLWPFTQNITVVAPEILPEVRNKGIELREKPFDESDLEGIFLVYTCTNLRELNAAVREAAHRRGILVNVVDNPVLCDFVSPAIIKDGHMTIAVGSNAQNVHKAIAWRNIIREGIGHGSIVLS